MRYKKDIVSSPSRNLQLHCKMGSWETTLQGLLILLVSTLTYQATIGDGRVSLYTGRAINGTGGRGSCLVDGLTYPSETAIPRDHPCHYCICYQSQVTCYWKQCAAAPRNCAVMHFENVCNPSLYMCQIPEKAPDLVPKSSSAQSALRLPIPEPLPCQDRRGPGGKGGEVVESRVRRAGGRPSPSSQRTPTTRHAPYLASSITLVKLLWVASDVCVWSADVLLARLFCFSSVLLPALAPCPSPRLRNTDLPPPANWNPPKPHPLSYVRNQYEESPYLDLGPFF
ncbi:hypothetical protein Pcinc_021267 [Petrolisthes cinctipes]|uniref:Uncharacterized protein n=1 Tax=Petrolisthes cinctipes TaxID=88211 RepID=A0AAE1KK48_PETCI|nr:hypothetical protein Pcinc_021267 [Petrolisthes cinctipes]